MYGIAKGAHKYAAEVHFMVFATFLSVAIKSNNILKYSLHDGHSRGRAFERYGEDNTIRAIGEIIEFDNPSLPTLHVLVKHFPEILDKFAKRCASTVSLRDKKGLTLKQTALSTEYKTIECPAIMFIEK